MLERIATHRICLGYDRPNYAQPIYTQLSVGTATLRFVIVGCSRRWGLKGSSET